VKRSLGVECTVVNKYQSHKAKYMTLEAKSKDKPKHQHHLLNAQEFYDMIMVDDDGEPLGWMTALQTAVTSIVLLWSLRAGRNVMSIPFAVSMDTDSEGWFSAPTLYQSSVGGR